MEEVYGRARNGFARISDSIACQKILSGKSKECHHICMKIDLKLLLQMINQF